MNGSREEQLQAENQELRRQLEAMREGTSAQGAEEWVKARLAAIVESSDDAIVSKNLQGIIATWNAGAQRMFGYTAAEMIGQPIQRIIPPERQDEETGILEKLRRGERVDHFNTQRIARDGHRIDVSLTISPIRDAQGVVVGASKIARDIGVHKRIEEELSRAKERAERANYEKDQFLAVLSHELRTPLMPLLAGLSLLDRSGGENGGALSNAEKAAAIATMRRNIELETQLIDDLLDHTRIMRGKIQLKREIANIHELIEAVVGMCGAEISAKELQVPLKLEAQARFAIVDPKRVQQVLWNLLKNAIKFTSKEGQVEIRTRNVESGNSPGSQSIVIEVADNGIGIAPDMIGRIFNPFEQGSRNITRRFGGLGLGLAISKSFVALHQGTLTAASEGRGQGSTFTVTLPGAMVMGPAILRPPSPGPDDGHAASASIGRGLRVLLVEDHADTRRMLTRLLRERGFAVEQVGTVAEARALLDRDQFDVLVSDIGLPDGTGLEVMQHARSTRRQAGGAAARGIAVSGFGTLEDERASRQAGFRMHLTKPLDVEKLEAAILAVGGGENMPLATGQAV